jgi:ferritin-like metal-binding protein YciE
MLKTLENLFVNQLKEVYYAEKKFHNYINRIASEISSIDLKELNNRIKNFCGMNIANLDSSFNFLSIKSFRKKPKAVEGIIEESNVLLKWNAPPTLIDSTIILSLRKLVHIFFSTYSSLKNMSRQLEFYEINHLIIENLDRHVYLNSNLNSLSLQINKNADSEVEVSEE